MSSPRVPESIPFPEATMMEKCEFIHRWIIDAELGSRLLLLQARSSLSWSIISGYRTVEEQLELAAQGRPAADPELSTHTECPATGADLWPVGVTPTNPVKVELGRAARLAGLRWGGGSPLDSDGIPSDWNHVDLGPRSSSR